MIITAEITNQEAGTSCEVTAPMEAAEILTEMIGLI